jgi:uncharacterized membrane protein
MSEPNESTPREISLDAGSAYGHGWKILWAFFLELLAVTVVSIAFGIPQWIWSGGPEFGTDQLLSFAYGILVLGPIEFGVAYVSLKAARGGPFKVGDMFESFRTYGHVVLANLLCYVIIVLGFVLLIVPGIIFLCKLAFVSYLVVERKMDATEAIKESWRMTRGHTGQVFLIFLIAIPVVLAGLLALGVGVIISIMWIRLALASLYNAVSGEWMKTVEGTPVEA